jgi:hypothetical protein
MKKPTEKNLQLAVCNYIKLQYPEAIFMTDVAAGMRLSVGQAVMASRMRSSRGLPDLFIAAARNGKHGLFVELKRAGIKIYKKDGKTFADQHLYEQALLLERLRSYGYEAEFAIGFDEAQKIIDKYFTK